MNFAERLEKALKKINKTQKDLAEYLEVPAGTISTWKKRNSIGKKYLNDVATFLNVPVDYLLGYNDDKIPLTRYLPIIGSASCGVPQKQYFDEVEMYPVSDDIYKDTRYLVKADGDSMLPKIKHGDLVLCDTNLNVDNNDIVHYTINNDESGIKKAIYKDNKIVMLMPTNSEFSPIIIEENDIVRIAKCIKVISDL